MDSQIVQQVPEQGRQDRPRGVIPIAAIQFVVSALIWLPSGLLLLNDAILYHRYAAAAAAPHALITLPKRSHPYYEVVVGLPLCLSVIGVLTGIGLLRLRSWARRVTLCMATVPAFACVAYLKLHHPKYVSDALFVVQDFTNVLAGCLLTILLPVSIWWWVFFMRADVRSRFRLKSQQARESTPMS